MQTDHIAVLVHNLEASSRTLPSSFTRHEVEEHAKEGTLEQYITVGDDDAVPALLLMQAIADGPYMRALAKRGPGLHHIGCICTSIEKEIASERTKRLLLHPISLETSKRGTVWLCRPGVPFLIELTQNMKQDAIPHKDVVLQLPETSLVAKDAREFSRNLKVKTSRGPTLSIELGGIEMTIDPNMG